jgi:nuclear receptor-binding protein
MTTSEDSAAAADDKPPTGNNSNNLNGIQQPLQNLQQPSTTTTINSQNSLTPTTTTDSTHESTISNSISPSGKKTVFFSKPETDTGVALPAETAAEAEAVLQAIAADEKNGDKSESDNEQDDEIVEEGRDGRWSKRKDKVKQRDVPGIDGSFLAMDNETGNEVVWNEVQFSERKNFRNQEEKIRTVFDNLMQLDHVNLVKFFDWWPDTKPEKPRIIFVTEYMSSGSMSKFLQRAKTSETLSNIRMWKKWTIQILSALNYLHSCDPPIAHANLSCNTIFIQQNGLIKIGCVAPNAIHHHVKTFRENIRNLHYIAPEYEYLNEVTPQADIYSFGICALEMATRGNIPSSSASNGTTTECTSNHMTQDILTKAIDSLENPMQRDFILKCIDPDPKNRPTAKELLFHPVLFEVHSLKLLAAHVIVNSKMIDYLSEDDLRIRDPSHTAFEFRGHIYTYADMEAFHSCKMDLDKFLEDVKNGIYPLIAFAPLAHRPLKLLSQSPSAIILPSTLTPKMADDSSIQTSASAPHVPGQQKQQNNSSITSTNPSNQGNRKNSVDDILGDNGSTNTTETNGTHSKTENEALTNSSKPSSSDAPSQQQLNLPNSTSSPNNLPPYIDTSSATSTITSMTGSLGSPTALEPSSTISSQGAPSSNGGDKPQGETRLIRHMRATIKDQILNILLQLDDYMNRQLTTEVNENDHADELVIELINHGFICQEDSDKVCSLLIKVLEEYREEISRGTGRTVEQEINIDQIQQKQKEEESEIINAASINSSSNNRPETLSSNSNTTSTETIIPTIQSPQAPKATPEDIEETSSPPSMTAPTTTKQHQ